MAPGGSDGSVSSSTARVAPVAVVVAEKFVETRTTEEATMAKVAEVVVAEPVTAVMRADEEAVMKAAADASAMKIAGQGVVVVKTTIGSVGSGSSPAPMVGSKRMVVPGGSTPPSK
jgi:hypothetical protein